MINSIEILSYVIVSLVLLAIIHFIYDGIIAPTIRFHLRNDLFSLRDRIRRLIIEGNLSNSDNETILFVDNSISFFLNKLSSLSLRTYYVARKEIIQNEELRKIIEKRLNSTRQLQNYEVQDIFAKAIMIVEKAFIFNSGILLLLVILIPMIIGLILVKKFKKHISALVMIPTKMANRFII
ncbi:MAG: hypothetical protein OXB84_09400 [Halobacteriovoraceae bacterium]|nr:hypothetical protein [Halobacteriovoraceae bacterium]